jgi:hypothetical protein
MDHTLNSNIDQTLEVTQIFMKQSLLLSSF